MDTKLRELEVLSTVINTKIALPKFQDPRNMVKGDTTPRVIDSYEISVFYHNQALVKKLEERITEIVNELYPDKVVETKVEE
jgi:hypothetical protein